MKLPKFLSRCLLLAVVIGLLYPSAARAEEKFTPQMIAFMGKYSLDEAWLGKLEKLAATVTDASKDAAFAKEFEEFNYDENIKKLFFDQAKEDVIPDDGSLNAYANAKYAKTAALLKSAGLTPYQYHATQGLMELYGKMADVSARGDALPDNKRIRDGVAFFSLNYKRLDKIGHVLR